MAKCDVCGNDYDKAFTVTMAGRTQTFDSFECAIHALAPSCAHCGCKVIGHGVSRQGEIFCCDHCARVTVARGRRVEEDEVAAFDVDLDDEELEDEDTEEDEEADEALPGRH